jgi:hypothetical protein
MTDDDKKRFALALGGLGEIFNEPVSKPKAAAYFLALRDLSIDQVEAAAAILLNTAKFFPKPVEFREAIAGTATDRADSAWRTIVKLCVEEGHYPSLYVTDGAMAFAIDHFGGWIEMQAKLADASPEMVRAYEKQFTASYRLGEKRQAQPTYFLGKIEAGNRGNLGGMERAKGQQMRIDVCRVKALEYQRLSMPFDLTTGALTGEARKALEAGAVQRFLPAPVNIAGYLPAASDEIAKPEEMALIKRRVETFVSQMSGRRMIGKVEQEDVEAFEDQEAV